MWGRKAELCVCENSYECGYFSGCFPSSINFKLSSRGRRISKPIPTEVLRSIDSQAYINALVVVSNNIKSEWSWPCITALRIYGVRSAGCGLKSQQWNDEVPLNMRNPFRSTRLFGSENYVLRLRYFHSCMQ